MSRTTLIILISFFGYIVNAQNNNQLEDGFTQFFYGNGQVSSEGMMRNGKPDGKWTTYHVNGKIKSVGLRKNFMLDSIWNFYDDKGELTESISYLKGNKSGYHLIYQKIPGVDSMVYSLKSQELFLDNRKEGTGYYYTEEGNLERLVKYKAGKKQGLTREFNADSIIQVIYKYHNDFMIDREFINQTDVRGYKQGLWREYYDNDNIRIERNYKDNLLNGYYREYDERGRILVSKFFNAGIEIEKDPEEEIQVDIVNQFDDDGKMIASGRFLEGIPIGIHREYTENESVVRTKEFNESGNVVSQGVMSEKGLKNEHWKFYFQNGNIRSEGDFRENLRVGEWKFYYPDGKLEQTGNYRNGLIDGLWTWFYNDGNVLREENYYRGKEDGASVEYDREGNIIAKGEYIEGNREGEWYFNVGDQVEKGSYTYGLKDGLWVHYYPNGKKSYEGRYVQGRKNGKHRLYHDNGKLKEDQYWEMGLKNRTWRKFDREENILLTSTYNNDILIKINGVRVELN